MSTCLQTGPTCLKTGTTCFKTGSICLRCRRDELRVPRRQSRIVLFSSQWVCLAPQTPKIQLPFTRLSHGTGSQAREVVVPHTPHPRVGQPTRCPSSTLPPALGGIVLVGGDFQDDRLLQPEGGDTPIPLRAGPEYDSRFRISSPTNFPQNCLQNTKASNKMAEGSENEFRSQFYHSNSMI